MTLKCKNCCHYYRTMTGKEGYNPAPYCHYFEDTGKRANVLTQECFEKQGKFIREKKEKKKMVDLSKRNELIKELERLHREQRGWQRLVDGEELNYSIIAQIPTDELEEIVEGLKNDKR